MVIIMSEVPILFKNSKECCGCFACYSICNNGAITMIEDGEGFLYPQIDEKKCVGCGRCLLICPIKKTT